MRNIMIAPSIYSMRTYMRCLRQSLHSWQAVELYCSWSSRQDLSFERIYFMFLMRLWCLKLLPSILHMILHNEKKYFFALNCLQCERKYLVESTSVSTPQIRLLNMAEKKDMKFQRMEISLRQMGFLESIVLTMVEMASRNLRNLKIFLLFFMAILTFNATLALKFLLASNKSNISWISEYLLQWQQNYARY